MIAITHARLIDGTGASRKEDMTVVARDGRIVSIEQGGTPPEEAIVVNAAGKTLIPGLIDLHTHFSGSSRWTRPGLASSDASIEYAEAREGFLQWGVTTVRTCGDMADDMFAFARAQREGAALPSPRVVACGPWFQAEGGHPYNTVYKGNEDIREKACIFVGETTDVAFEVERVQAAGADFVKLFLAHIDRTNNGASVPTIDRGQAARIVDAAHARGMKVAVHVDSVGEMVEAARLGADTIEHCVNVGSVNPALTDEMVEAVKTSGAAVVPTMVALRPWEEFCGFENSVYPYDLALTRRFYSEGIPLGIGCDSGIPMIAFGESLHDEMANFASAGIDPLDVIRIATRENAEILGLSKDVGTIEAGKCADMVLLSADPLSDIRNTKKISMVIRSGRIVGDSIPAEYRRYF